MTSAAVLTERDTVNADGTFNRAAILKIALLRARAERDLDILVAARGFGPIRLPAGIASHNVAAWRAEQAAKLDRKGLALTPFKRLFAAELRRAWDGARAVRKGLALREETLRQPVVSFLRVKLIDNLIDSIGAAQ